MTCKFLKFKFVNSSYTKWIKISDSTGTVSGTVSARNNVGSVRSRNDFCSEATTESWCVAHGGRWGVVRRECKQQMSVAHYPLTPAPSTQQAGRRANANVTANDPEIPRTCHPYHAHTPGCTGTHQS